MGVDSAWDIIAGGEKSYIGKSFLAFDRGKYCWKAQVNEPITAANVSIIDSSGADVTSEYIDTSSVTTLKPGTTLTFKDPVYYVGAGDGSFVFVQKGAVSQDPFDPAIFALLSQALTDGYTAASGSTLTALDTMIKSLKADGIWNKLDVMYVFATNGDSDFATYNIIDPTTFQATKVNAPTFTSLEGFTGDGASSYLNTTFQPATDGTNYTLDDASLGVYVRNFGAATGVALIGGRHITNAFSQITALSGTNVGARLNQASTSYVQGTRAAGFIQGNRTDASTINIYQNGSLLNSQSIISDTLTDCEIPILAFDNTGSITGYSDAQISIAYMGADFSTQASDFYTAIQTYMTALGTEV